MTRNEIVKYALAGAVGGISLVFLVQRYRMYNGHGRLHRSPVPDPLAITHDVGPNVIMLAPEYGVIRVDHVDKFRRDLERAEDEVTVIIHTLGGSVLAVDHIAHMLRQWKGKVRVVVPYMALSGGTMIALGADEIVMDDSAILGPVDPQIDGWPAVSLMELVEAKPREAIDDEWMLLAMESAKAMQETRETVRSYGVNALALERLTSGKTTHARPIDVNEAGVLGLPVRTGVPAEYVLALDAVLAERASRPRGGCIILPGGFQADQRTGLLVTRVASPEPQPEIKREEN